LRVESAQLGNDRRERRDDERSSRVSSRLFDRRKEGVDASIRRRFVLSEQILRASQHEIEARIRA
jgi:hypothetical protein